MIWRDLLSAATWKRTLHLLLDMPLGIAWFTIAITGLSVGIGLIPLMLIGIPILGLTLVAGRWISAVERARARVLLDLDVASPFRPLPRRGNVRQWARAIFADGPAWRAIAYSFVMLPLGIAMFTVVVTLWSVAISMAFLPIYAWLPGSGRPEFGDWQPDGAAYAAMVVAGTVAGWLLLAAAPHAVRALATVDRGLIAALLGPTASESLSREMSNLEASRVASVGAASTERARIERDLHDGVQPRLVAAAMELGLARDRLASGQPVDRVDELLARAHDETKAAITELRELVRGIHPAILVDRGLEPALSSLAGRLPFPIDLDVRLAHRLAPEIESAAYFVIAEALTNVVKHASAKRARVSIAHDGEMLTIEVFDNGRGGAHIAPSGGLSGIRDRIVAVRGNLRVASPPGGPTTLFAEVPCASR